MRRAESTVNSQMSRQAAIPMAYALGVVLMLIALFLVTATFATNDYTTTLLSAAALAAIAAICFGFVIVIAPVRWRIIALISSLPLLYVIFEVIRRGIL